MNSKLANIYLTYSTEFQVNNSGSRKKFKLRRIHDLGATVSQSVSSQFEELNPLPLNPRIFFSALERFTASFRTRPSTNRSTLTCARQISGLPATR